MAHWSATSDSDPDPHLNCRLDPDPHSIYLSIYYNYSDFYADISKQALKGQSHKIFDLCFFLLLLFGPLTENNENRCQKYHDTVLFSCISKYIITSCVVFTFYNVPYRLDQLISNGMFATIKRHFANLPNRSMRKKQRSKILWDCPFKVCFDI